MKQCSHSLAAHEIITDGHITIAVQILMVFGVGGGVGVCGGGYIGQKLYVKRKRVMPLFVAVCVMTAALPMLWVVNAPLKTYAWYAPYIPAFLGGMLASGRPVVAAVRPDGSVAHGMGGEGTLVPPGDAEAPTANVVLNPPPVSNTVPPAIGTSASASTQ